MKDFVGAGVLVVFAILARFGTLFQRMGVSFYQHGAIRTIPLSLVGFWLLVGLRTQAHPPLTFSEVHIGKWTPPVSA